MKILLKEDVDNLGLAGEVKKVARGYGRNYLIPRGMAEMATPGNMKKANVWAARAAARREEMRAEYEALSARIEQLRLVFIAKASDGGRLYGSVTNPNIVERLNEELGTTIDRRKVVGGPLRDLGEHAIRVRLNADFQPNFTVVLESDGEIEEEEVVVEDGEDMAADGAEVAEDSAETVAEEATDAVEEAAEVVEEAVADETDAE